MVLTATSACPNCQVSPSNTFTITIFRVNMLFLGGDGAEGTWAVAPIETRPLPQSVAAREHAITAKKDYPPCERKVRVSSGLVSIKDGVGEDPAQ